MTDNPAVFHVALQDFMEQVYLKATRRAKEKQRPMNPWDFYQPSFIRAKLVEEIGELLMLHTKTGGYKGSAEEDSELFDVCALAASLWKANHRENVPLEKDGY